MTEHAFPQGLSEEEEMELFYQFYLLVEEEMECLLNGDAEVVVLD